MSARVIVKDASWALMQAVRDELGDGCAVAVYALHRYGPPNNNSEPIIVAYWAGSGIDGLLIEQANALAQVADRLEADSVTFPHKGYSGAVTLHGDDGEIIGYLVVVSRQKDEVNHQVVLRAAENLGLRPNKPDA